MPVSDLADYTGISPWGQIIPDPILAFATGLGVLGLVGFGLSRILLPSEMRKLWMAPLVIFELVCILALATVVAAAVNRKWERLAVYVVATMDAWAVYVRRDRDVLPIWETEAWRTTSGKARAKSNQASVERP